MVAIRNALGAERREAQSYERLCPQRRARAMLAWTVGYLDEGRRTDGLAAAWRRAWCVSRGVPDVRVRCIGRADVLELEQLLRRFTVLPPVVRERLGRPGPVVRRMDPRDQGDVGRPRDPDTDP